MKITIVSDILGEANNGTAIACMNLINYLKECGDEVRVLCCDQSKKGIPGYYVVPTLKLIYPLNKIVEKNNVTLPKPCKKTILKALDGVDVCHVMLPFALGKKASKYAKKLNIPVTAGFHCQAENFTAHFGIGMYSRFFNRMVYRHFYNKCYKIAKAIHYPTQFIKNTFESEIKKKTNGYVISNGVNDQYRPLSIIKREAPYNKYFNILFIGRLCKEKSQKTLVEAVARSKYKRNIQIVFAGQGPDEEKILKLAKKRKINTPIIKFYDREELIKIINSCDLYVHASEIEIEAIAALEAISCGLIPIISDSKKSATNAFALDSNNLFKNRNYFDLSKKIDYWIEHEDLKKIYQQRYKDFSKDYSQKHCMNQMRNMLVNIGENNL